MFVFLKELREKLIQIYEPKKYFEKQEVNSILEFGLNFFAEKFEEWCISNFNHIEDLLKILHSYSGYAQSINNGEFEPQKELKICLFTARYILSLAPKIKWRQTGEQLIHNNQIILPELFALTQLIIDFGNKRCIAGLSGKQVLEVNLKQNWVSVEYSDKDLEKKIINVADKNDRILFPQLVDYNLSIQFRELLSKTFGVVAEELFALMIPNPELYLDNMNLEQFQHFFQNTLPYDAKFFFGIDKDPTPINITSFIKRNTSSLFLKPLIHTPYSTDFKKVIFKPHLTDNRTRFKPIIEIRVDNEVIYITSKWLLFEAYSELCINQLPNGGLPKDWLKIKSIKNYANEVKSLAGHKFEQFVHEKIEKRFRPHPNIKHIGNISIERAPILDKDGNIIRTVGEIDFIMINEVKKIIYVADAKFLKSKYLITSFYNDKAKFDGYEIKLLDKAEWVQKNKLLISQLMGVDVDNYEVQPCFITDAFILYSLFVDYPIIPVSYLNKYLETNNRFVFLINEEK